jgi:serine/threonine protein phosphatase PrpC
VNYLFSGESLRNKRPVNMDSLLLKCGMIREKKALLAVVCDGVGSLADGAFASKRAVQMLSEWFSKADTACRIGLALRDAIITINGHVMKEAGKANIKAASTLSALLLINRYYYIVHIGDSRIYSCEDETLSILTCDDISEEGKLTACIGQTENIFLQYYEGKASGKTFLICSDGLYKRMDTDFLRSQLKDWDKCSAEEAIKNLTQYVIEQGEQDNISIALVKTED